MDDWYEEFMPGTYLEDDLEKTILARSADVFPDYFMLPMKQTIEYEDEKSQPDLCLIKKDYTDWLIIEVELAKKPFKGHTEMQVRVFSQGRYNARAIAKYLKGKNKALNQSKTESLIRSQMPKVLVMVNEYPNWAEEVLAYPRTGILVFGMFDHPDGVEAYRIDGQYPLHEISRTRCVFPKFPANTLKVYDPTILDINHKEQMTIIYEGRRTKWERINYGTKTVLIPVGYNPLNVNKKYYLIKDKSKDFYFKEN